MPRQVHPHHLEPPGQPFPHRLPGGQGLGEPVHQHHPFPVGVVAAVGRWQVPFPMWVERAVAGWPLPFQLWVERAVDGRPLPFPVGIGEVVDNGRHPFTGWATLPHRGTRYRTGWVSRARSGWVDGALDAVVEGAGVVDHAGSLA
jgi:hypothetical protein